MDAVVGHNSNELTELERKTLHMSHFNVALQTESELKALKERRKTERKKAKADGIILSDLDFMLRINEAEQPELIAEELKRRNEIAKWMALPLHFQADFDFDREPAVDRAFRDGVLLGTRNAPPPPAGAGEIEQAMLAGWHEGRRQMTEELATALEKRERQLAQQADDETDDDEEEEAA